MAEERTSGRVSEEKSIIEERLCGYLMQCSVRHSYLLHSSVFLNGQSPILYSRIVYIKGLLLCY